MGRKTEFPDVFTIRLPAGGTAALKAVLREGETPSDAAREAVQMLVAERRLWEDSRPKPREPKEDRPDG